jgi:hypothetical protein
MRRCLRRETLGEGGRPDAGVAGDDVPTATLGGRGGLAGWDDKSVIGEHRRQQHHSREDQHAENLALQLRVHSFKLGRSWHVVEEICFISRRTRAATLSHRWRADGRSMRVRGRRREGTARRAAAAAAGAGADISQTRQAQRAHLEADQMTKIA